MAEIEIWNNPEKLNPLAFKNEMEVQSALYVANNNTNKNKYVNI